MALSKDKTEAGGAVFGPPADQHEDTDPAVPEIRRREDSIKFDFDEEPVRPGKCVRRLRQGDA